MSDADKPVFDLTAWGIRHCPEPELRARIAELTRERTKARAQRNLSQKTRIEDVGQLRSQLAAARAERDEAVRHLRNLRALLCQFVGAFIVCSNPVAEADAFLARPSTARIPT